MRVNHAGEIAAQALYHGQVAVRARRRDAELCSRTPRAKNAITSPGAPRRIEELGGRTSWLTPFWYAGSFGIGVLAGLRADAESLGFVRETERQVEAHLRDHLERLPRGRRKKRGDSVADGRRRGAPWDDRGARRRRRAAGRDPRLYAPRRRNLASSCADRVTYVAPCPMTCLRRTRELIKYSVKSNRSSDVWLKKLCGP